MTILDRLVSAEKVLEVLKTHIPFVDESKLKEMVDEIPTYVNLTVTGDLISRSSIREALDEVTNDEDCPLHIGADILQTVDYEPAIDLKDVKQ